MSNSRLVLRALAQRPGFGRIRDGPARILFALLAASRNPSRNWRVSLVFRDGFRDDLFVDGVAAYSNAVRIGPGDTLVIYKPDRVARSMKELLVLLEDDLHAKNINLHILTGICAGVHRPKAAPAAGRRCSTRRAPRLLHVCR